MVHPHFQQRIKKQNILSCALPQVAESKATVISVRNNFKIVYECKNHLNVCECALFYANVTIAYKEVTNNCRNLFVPLPKRSNFRSSSCSFVHFFKIQSSYDTYETTYDICEWVTIYIYKITRGRTMQNLWLRGSVRHY